MGSLSKGVWERVEMEKMRHNYIRSTVAMYKLMPGFENCFDPLKD